MWSRLLVFVQRGDGLAALLQHHVRRLIGPHRRFVRLPAEKSRVELLGSAAVARRQLIPTEGSRRILGHFGHRAPRESDSIYAASALRQSRSGGNPIIGV